MKSQKRIIIIGSAKPDSKARPLQLTAESKDGKAYIRIIGRIANWNANNSSDFQKKVDELLKTHTEANVYINSNGGSVFEAVEINNQLNRFDKVNITVGASAASAATYFTACHYTSAYANSQIMIHKPMLGTFGNEDQITKELKLLRSVTKDYLAKYTKKTGKTTTEIEELWKGGDHWMSAEEAKTEGFIDAIIDEDGTISAEDVTTLEACGAPIVPKATTQKTNQKQIQIMNREEQIAFLGLEASATDAEITAAQKAMKIDALKQREATAAATDAQKTAAEKEVNTLVDAAIAVKKITADQKQTYVDLATANFDAAKTALEAMVTKPKLSADLTPADGNDALEASRKEWTLEDYLDKDPQAYEKMKVENPKQADALEAGYFGDQQ
ncbi:peptidase, S14 family [Formosa sp. Hel1_33_131]|uniref:Clp protease ClpP n=1 Tax=Formosa sp. Hel1_33_131 TaxID=1336794 RepID=UPI00084E2FCE|nr:ATP-dependent Clp protease proteolytic subunit [Formosa sp. Hel1_33_131]AOR29549.1 peptidase, S14 family [Formosa sp. Hel1_33_131]